MTGAIKEVAMCSRELTRRRAVNDPSRVTVVLLRKSKFEIPIHLSRLLAQAQHLRAVCKAALVAILRPVDRAESSSTLPNNVLHVLRRDTQTNVLQ